MKREDQTYEKWLDKLKNTEPVLNAPEELTNYILNKISFLSSSGTSLLKEAKGKSKTNRILLSVSKISGIAAALLLCFLISETIFFSQDKQYPEQYYANNAIWQGKAYSLPDSWNPESSLLEKSRYLSEQWKEYIEKLSKRKASFLSKRISVETIIH